MEHPACGRARVSGRRLAPRALLPCPAVRRDQQLVPSPARCKGVRTVGCVNAVVVPLLGQAAARDNARRRAAATGPLLDAFFAQIGGLGEKLGALLVQLPPSQVFNLRVGGTFFSKLRERYAGPVVCEPRHITWFEKKAEELLVRHRVARVATDPSRIQAALHPGGWRPDLCRPANPESSITACTDRRESTGRVIRPSGSSSGRRDRSAAGTHRHMVHLR